MKALSLVVVSLLIWDLEAQMTFPDENVEQRWEYVTRYWFGGECEYKMFKNGALDSICGEAYIEFFECINQDLTGQPLDTCYLRGYYRIEDDKVYSRINATYSNGFIDSVDCAIPEFLFYDFGVETGDTVQGMHFRIPQEYTIISHYQEEFYGTERKVLDLEFRPFTGVPDLIDEMLWIEGIGSNKHPFFPYTCINNNCDTEYRVSKVTRSGELIYANKNIQFLDGTCSTYLNAPLITSVNDIPKNVSRFRIYPCPSSSFLIVDQLDSMPTNIYTLEIYNSLGNLLLSIPDYHLQSQIDIQDFVSGIYLLVISDSQQRSIEKFVVKN